MRHKNLGLGVEKILSCEEYHKHGKKQNIIEEGIKMYSIYSTFVANTIYQNFVICILIQYKQTSYVTKFIKALANSIRIGNKM